MSEPLEPAPPGPPPHGEEAATVATGDDYRNLVEIGSDYAYFASVSDDGALRLEWVTGNFEAITGYKPSEVSDAEAWVRFIDPEDVPMLAQIIEGFLNNRSWVGEVRLRRPDGERVWTRTAARPILDDDGELVGVYGAVHDISEQKRAQIALEEANTRYKDLVEQVPGVVYSAEQGIRGRWHFVGSKIQPLLGFEPDEWLANPNIWFDHVHPDDQDTVMEMDATLHLTGDDQDRTIEYRMIGRDGRTVWIRDAQTFDVAGPNEPMLIRGILFDVTKEKLAERALMENEQMYRSLFFHHPDAVCSLDTEGRFVSVNARGAAFTGYDAKDLLGRMFHDLFDESDVVYVDERVDQSLRGEVQEYAATLVRRDGSRRAMAVTNLPIIVNGEVVGVYGIAKDVTDTKLLEDQMQQTQKMEALGQLAGGVAHDLNNLLSVILNYTDFLAHDQSDAARTEDLAEIRTAAERASALTKELLVFSRREPADLRPVDINAAVERFAGVLEKTVGPEIEIQIDLAPGLPPVKADPYQVEQVLINLVLNAREAMPGGGTVHISTRVDRGDRSKVELCVRDSGMGMTDDVRRRAMDPFFTTKPSGHGSGLGLSTVFGFVTRWDGTLAIASEEGRGTEVTIRLEPLPSTEEGRSGAATKVETSGGISRVLVVDDEEALRKVAARILQKNGMQVVAVGDGPAAIEAVEREPGGFDLILTDVVMPKMSGIELVKELRRRGHTMSALYMSGYSTDVIERHGEPDGPLIEKPFTAGDLLEALAKL